MGIKASVGMYKKYCTFSDDAWLGRYLLRVYFCINRVLVAMLVIVIIHINIGYHEIVVIFSSVRLYMCIGWS